MRSGREGLFLMMRLVQYPVARRRALQFGLAAIYCSAGFGTTPYAEAQQISAPLASAAPTADAPKPLLSLAQTAEPTAGSAGPQDGKLSLSLKQAFKMALENNLDL